MFSQNGQKINPASTTSPGPEPLPPVHPPPTWKARNRLTSSGPTRSHRRNRPDQANNPNSLIDGVDIARNLPGVSVVSLSWGMPEFLNSPSYNPVFTTPQGHRSETFLAATGVSGALGAWYPAYSPGVVAVGATTLTIGEQLVRIGDGLERQRRRSYQARARASLSRSCSTIGAAQFPTSHFIGDPAFGTAVYDSFDYPATTLGFSGVARAWPLPAGQA